MKTQLFSAAVLAFASSAAHGQSQAVQWRVEDGGNGHWYALVQWEQDITWVTARDWAVDHGGHLVTMTSAQEDAFATTVAVSQPWPNQFRGPYIGAFSTTSCGSNSCYSWVTGEPFAYTRWHPGNPDASPDCPGLVSTCFWEQFGSRAWQDVDACHSLTSFRLAVVEWSADCNSDGIVDYGQCRNGSLPDYNGNNIPDCCETGTPCVVGNYPVQWHVEDGGNGHWYAKVASSPLPTTISAMQGFAASRGADLASIASAAENQKILTLLESIGAGESFSAWIGLYRAMPGDPWRWTDGSETPWVGWGGASCTSGPYPNDTPFPGELGTVIYRQNCGLVWDDSATAWIQNPPPWWGGVAGMTLILEWSADCNGDGIVDYGQILAGQLADVNGNGVPDSCDPIPCLADVNNSGSVNGVDLAAVLGAWGTSGQADGDADINNDGIVNGQDLAFVLGAWGPCP